MIYKGFNAKKNFECAESGASSFIIMQNFGGKGDAAERERERIDK